MNRIQIDINEPQAGWFACKVKTGNAKYRDPLYTDDINAVVGWLADHGIKEQVPAPAAEDVVTVGGAAV